MTHPDGAWRGLGPQGLQLCLSLSTADFSALNPDCTCFCIRQRGKPWSFTHAASVARLSQHTDGGNVSLSSGHVICIFPLENPA